MKNIQKIGLLIQIAYNVICVFILTGWTDKKAIIREIKLVLD